MDAIETEHLTKTYREIGKRAVHSLRDVSLSVQENEIYGFLGRNGAGKTTTIKILCSLVKPSSGRARIFGGDARARETRRRIGYLPEQPYFYEYLTPRETIEFYGRLRGLNPAERAAAWERLADLLDLRDIADHRIKGFSKGMRQRVGFAVALVGDPPLLILDEPMSGLDPIGRRTIRELIVRLRNEKKTIFFSSHVLSDVELICDRIGILVKGELTRQGRIDELLTGHVDAVEVVAAGLAAESADRIGASAQQRRSADGQELFTFSEPAQANEAVRAIHASGGELIGFNHVKARLEDYFIGEQRRASGGVDEGGRVA